MENVTMNPIHKALMDRATLVLLPYNDTRELPADVEREIKEINKMLSADRRRLKITYVNDGMQRGRIVQLESL
jgi:hypothetical protein